LPRLKDKITANYPGTRLALTEYNYGSGGHISGAIAQADVLGIFGRENIFVATLWRLSGSTRDQASATVYGTVNDGDATRMVIVAINKTDSAQTAGIAVTHTVQFH